MDPISATGIGLSVTSLVLQLFSGCIKGYQMLLDVADMPEKFQHLKIVMQLEQARLLHWGEKVGLLEDVLQEPSITLQLHRNLIFDILLEIQGLFREALRTEANFSVIASARPSVQVNTRIASAPLSSSKRTDVMLARALRVFEKVGEVPKRLQWVMVKQDKFEKLIDGLIRYNDSMGSLLDRVTLQQVHEMNTQTQLIMLQMSSQIGELKQLTQAMQMKTKENSATTRLGTLTGLPTTPMMVGTYQHDNSLATLATFKADRIAIEGATSHTTQPMVDRKDIHFQEANGLRELGHYHNRRVWIEWKEYDQHSQHPYWKDMIESRVLKLATLLGMKDKPVEFRAPNCIGCFHDADEATARYGLVYEIPTIGSRTPMPRSLLDLLKLKSSRKPSLTQRLKLASTLANSMMYLHSVNWLHKGIRSDSVLFMVVDDQEVDFSSPTISGFEYARPDLPHEMTEKADENLEHDMYRHPTALVRLDTRSRKSWDIYSLGIILVEIAFWKSIGVIMDIEDVGQKSIRSSIRKIRSRILDTGFLNEIGARVGERYQEVVYRCISGGLELGIGTGADESDPAVGAEMLDVFSEQVVRRLQGIQL